MGKPKSADKPKQGSTPSAEDLKLPTTLEEFLKAEKLADWPYKLSLEGPLDIQGEGLLLGTKDDIADILRESAPLGLSLLDDLEDRVKKVEDKLNRYAVHIVTDDVRPSRLAERLFHSPSRTFMTEVSNSDAVKSHYSSRGHKSAEFADALMETKKRSLDYCVFPGFCHGELVELPGQLEAPPLLHRITNVQKFNPGFRKFWKKLFLSEASAAMMQDTFWWIFLDQFNTEKGLEEEKDLLFDRIADSYVALFNSINSDVKDKFLSVYPDCLAQAIFSAYITTFRESSMRFEADFKQYLVNLTHEWVTGLKPIPGTWKAWDIQSLEAEDHVAHAETSAAAKKMMEATALNKKVEAYLDMDSFTKVMRGLGQDMYESPDIPSAVPTRSRLAIYIPSGVKKKSQRESHQIGPGPEYERVKFNTQGRSPLISHYLHMRQLRDYRQPGTAKANSLQSPEPSDFLNLHTKPGPTYQQYIQNKLNVSENLSREYTRICEQTAQEIAELDRKKAEMNRTIDSLQRELANARNSTDRRHMIERMEFIRERERETTPLLSARPESALTASVDEMEES
ncbi:hypothetical protein BaRGS_00011908 [Batillaria attramentaria]|uniref:Protein FAM227B n=1 Tax=Batillaria attramentaria TaxID=370345 RepID=A0ABD0LBY8_9CAEN